MKWLTENNYFLSSPNVKDSNTTTKFHINLGLKVGVL